MSRYTVAQVLIQPRIFERKFSEADNEAVDDLVRAFHSGMRGKTLAIAAQALGTLTADYCKEVSEKGGESICALQDIAGRGQEYLKASVTADAAIHKAQKSVADPILRRPRRRRKVT